jgi:hypothetical protein
MATVIAMVLVFLTMTFPMGIRAGGRTMVAVARISMGGEVRANDGYPQGQGDRDCPQT